jgi:hypothetical protein
MAACGYYATAIILLTRDGQPVANLGKLEDREIYKTFIKKKNVFLSQ